MTCDQTCATCVFWDRQAPQLAGAELDPSCPAELGTCHFAPPIVAPAAGMFPVTIWPRTHQDRWCGGWETAGAAGPDGGEVLEFRRAAA